MKSKSLFAALALALPMAATAQVYPLMANQMAHNQAQAAAVAKAEQGNKPIGCGVETAGPEHIGALTACMTGQHGHGSKAVEAAQLKTAADIVAEAKKAGGNGSYTTMRIDGITGLDTLGVVLDAKGVVAKSAETQAIVDGLAALGKSAPRPVSILVYGPGNDERDWIQNELRQGYPGGEINALYSAGFRVVVMEGG